ncbi:hypothetical protein B0H17DRAFT_1146029 [Mycena rosella]|uniref:Uncharacterized protein n=1 Tax=Mycena rosella TaxID=1033263 RepID=A0AAD7G3W4_MYCRO|nr:hypothetical protein B0H17DRAFT_1146029 [Mycena rosella]
MYSNVTVSTIQLGARATAWPGKLGSDDSREPTPKAVTPASAPEPAARKATRGCSHAPVEEPKDDADADSVPDLDVGAVVPLKRRCARSVKPAPVKDEETEAVLEAEGTAPPTRAPRKEAVPASAPAAVEALEKENTPGEEREEEAPAVKVRVSRSRKVKEKVMATDANVPRRAKRVYTTTTTRTSGASVGKKEENSMIRY